MLRCCSGAGLAVLGGRVGGIATIGLRHADDTPWWGVYGSKTPRWRGRVAVAEPRTGVQGWRVIVVCVPGYRQSAFGRAVVAVVGGCVGGIATIGV